MRIVCVSYLHCAGGAERQIISLANALSDFGHEVFLIILAENNQRYTVSNKIKIVDLSYIEKKKGVRILNRFFAFKKAIKEISPDVSIHFWLQSVYYSYLLNEKDKGFLIYSERTDPGGDEYNGLLGFVRNVAFKKVNFFVFQSQAAKQFFSNNIQLRSTVIANAVHVYNEKLDIYYHNDKSEKTIINVGRFHPQKNQALLIKSFARITNNIPDYKLHIYGEGELRDDLLKLINKLNLEGKVYLFSSTHNIHEIMKKSSLFVLSSNYEGMPNVLLEAMALGKICISTDYRPGGIEDIIDDEKNGYIVPRGDEKALAKKMLFVIKNIDDLDEISKKALEIGKTNSPAVIYGKWNDVITYYVSK